MRVFRSDIRISLAAVAALAAIAAYYWHSSWPLAVGAAVIAVAALEVALRVGGDTRLLWNLSYPARPLRMRWTFSVVLTDRAWDTLGIPAGQRERLQEIMGSWDGSGDFLFPGNPNPKWISDPIGVTYERWGNSIERWTIENGWFPSAPNFSGTYIRLPEIDEGHFLQFWGDRDEGPLFLFQGDLLPGHLLFLGCDESVSLTPDGASLHVKDSAHVLFDIPAPTLSMSHEDRGPSWVESRGTGWIPRPLDRFAAPDELGDWGGPSYIGGHGEERFECVDWEKGFRWDLTVNDLRPLLSARVIRVRRSRSRKQIREIGLELRDSGTWLLADYRLVAPDTNGRTVPRKGEEVEVVLNDEGRVDRVFLYDRR